MIRFAPCIVLALLGGLPGCGSSNEESLLELSPKEIHLEAVFGGESSKSRLKVSGTGLIFELSGTEQVSWLGISQTTDGTDLGVRFYDFWASDSKLPEAHHRLRLHFDVFRQVDPAFKRLVGSSSLQLTYDIRNAIGFQQELHPFKRCSHEAPSSGILPASSARGKPGRCGLRSRG